MTDIYEVVGAKWAAWLQSQRAARGLTQAELAALIGVSRATVARWEAGGIVTDYGKVLHAAKVFGLDPQDVLTEVSAPVDRPGADEAKRASIEVGSTFAEESNRTWPSFIRDLRVARRLTQDEFAAKVGVSRHTVMRWEAGTTPNDPETVARVADAFRLQTSDLLMLLAEPGETQLPPPLPQELAELVRVYQQLPDGPARRTLLERVAWISEWAIAVLVREGLDRTPGDGNTA